MLENLSTFVCSTLWVPRLTFSCRSHAASLAFVQLLVCVDDRVESDTGSRSTDNSNQMASSYGRDSGPKPSSSLSDLRSQLKDELRTMEMILFKHNNQHRRTFYFRSFQSTVKIAKSLLSQTKKSEITHKEGSKGESAAGKGELSVDAKKEALVKAAKRADAALASILLHARRVTMQQKGAGFANFMAVLTASVANVLLISKGIRDALQAKAETTTASAARS